MSDGRKNHGSTLERQAQQPQNYSTFLKHGLGCCPTHLLALPLEHKGATFKKLALSPLAGNNARPEGRTEPCFLHLLLITQLPNSASTSYFSLTSNATSYPFQCPKADPIPTLLLLLCSHCILPNFF